MYKILNFFFLTKTFDNLNSFLSRKIFKILKIFFVETKLHSLPDENHKLNTIDINQEIETFNKVKNDNYIPWTAQDNLHELIKDLNLKENKLLDVGAGSLSLFAFLEKKLKKLEYLYFDQPLFSSINEKIILKFNLSNLKILKNLDNLDNDIELIYFGSSLQYFNNYKDILFKIFNKSKFILISLTPFFENFDKNNLIVKQINMHPTIYYHYIFDIEKFINFMQENNYLLVKKNRNSKIKFINFKNFKKEYKHLFMYDLMFEKQ